ncbi:MAG: GtrA family protein [Oscillospiraceae bacterium]
MEKIKRLYLKHKELILYVFFGGLTTLCNLICYYIFAHIFSIDEITSTIISFIVSVLFAFFTNRRYVFMSNAKGVKQVTNELARFFGARLFSGGLDVLMMYLFVTLLLFNDMLIKILSNIVVIILNYIFSKLFVFRKKT